MSLQSLLSSSENNNISNERKVPPRTVLLPDGVELTYRRYGFTLCDTNKVRVYLDNWQQVLKELQTIYSTKRKLANIKDIADAIYESNSVLQQCVSDINMAMEIQIRELIHDYEVLKNAREQRSEDDIRDTVDIPVEEQVHESTLVEDDEGEEGLSAIRKAIHTEADG